MSKVKIVTFSIISIILIIVIVGIIVFCSITSDTKLDENKLRQDKANLTLLDNSNTDIKYSSHNYQPYSKISTNIINAFVALEDKRFYKHDGLDYKRIAGAIINNMKSGSYREGASTITQQLIKNTHLTSEKTIIRKLNEAKLARLLEKNYSKNDILEMYLNVIYFGSSIYGVHDATMSYYGKNPENITISESAMLAGVVKSPRNYSPQLNYDKSIERRNVVLKVMLNNEYISENEYNTAVVENIVIKNALIENNYTKKYCNEAISQASSLTGLSEKELVSSGFTVKTYMDSAAQAAIYNKSRAESLNPHNANNVELILDNLTGGVKAYYSNLSIPLSTITAIAGSTLKPLSVYAPALEQSLISPADKILDEQIDIDGYAPSNYNNIYHGYVTIRESIANSYNTPAVKLMSKLGIATSTNLLNQFNIATAETDENLSLALGSLTVNPLAMASAYSCIARGGEYKNSSFISEIYNNKGKLIFSNGAESHRAISESTAYLLTDMLTSSVTNGTCQKLKYLPYQIAAKSGTVAAENRLTRDAWCVAYTSRDTMLSWHGAENGNYLPQSYGGGGYPAMILQSVMREYYDATNNPPAFIMPTTVQTYPIDRDLHINHNRVTLGTDMTYTDNFSIFNPPVVLPHQDSNTDDLPLISISNINGRQTILLNNLTVGSTYQLYKKATFFGKYHLIDSFTCLNHENVIIDNQPISSNRWLKYKLVKDNITIAVLSP